MADLPPPDLDQLHRQARELQPLLAGRALDARRMPRAGQGTPG